MADLWDPQRYERFEEERSRPFFDLLSYVHPVADMRILDLGCGTAKLTVAAHQRFGACSTLGVDASAAMLAKATDPPPAGFRTRLIRIEDFDPGRERYDLVLSNAALHWVENHEALFTRICGWVRPGGHLAVQMPANEPHASHSVADSVAGEEPFASALGGYARKTPVLAPEAYVRILKKAGMKVPASEYRTYYHQLASSAAIVEWVRGTLLTDYQRRMRPDIHDRFIARYTERLVKEVGDVAPYEFAFRRLFVTARKSR